MGKITLKSIFPINIYQVNIKENDELKEKFLDKIVNSYKEGAVKPPSGWNTNKMHTSFSNDAMNDLVFSQNNFPEKIYYSYINDYIMDDTWIGGITEFWYNCYISGDYQEKHNHCNELGPSPHFSAIHYLSFDKKRHNPVTFCDPLSCLRCLSLELNQESVITHFLPDIEEGDLLFFPSYLDHFVRPSVETPDYPRVTISFNFHLEEYGKIV